MGGWVLKLTASGQGFRCGFGHPGGGGGGGRGGWRGGWGAGGGGGEEEGGLSGVRAASSVAEDRGAESERRGDVRTHGSLTWSGELGQKY